MLPEGQEEAWVYLLEFCDDFLVHNYQNGGEDGATMSVHKKLVAYLFLIDKVTQVLYHQGGAFLLGQGVELVL